MILGHYACIGYTDVKRDGRYLVETFTCVVCRKTHRTIVESPRWYHELLNAWKIQ